jgi:hypothetical protein
MYNEGRLLSTLNLQDEFMENCKHVLVRPKIEDIMEFCEDGDPNYALVKVRCLLCGMEGGAQANLDWVGAMWDLEWIDDLEFE